MSPSLTVGGSQYSMDSVAIVTYDKKELVKESLRQVRMSDQYFYTTNMVRAPADRFFYIRVSTAEAVLRYAGMTGDYFSACSGARCGRPGQGVSALHRH